MHFQVWVDRMYGRVGRIFGKWRMLHLIFGQALEIWHKNVGHNKELTGDLVLFIYVRFPASLSLYISDIRLYEYLRPDIRSSRYNDPRLQV